MPGLKKQGQRVETMTSRERVLKTINHEVPDRMPIDFGMHNATGISAFAYWNLREYPKTSHTPGEDYQRMCACSVSARLASRKHGVRHFRTKDWRS